MNMQEGVKHWKQEKQAIRGKYKIRQSEVTRKQTSIEEYVGKLTSTYKQEKRQAQKIERDKHRQICRKGYNTIWLRKYARTGKQEIRKAEMKMQKRRQ